MGAFLNMHADLSHTNLARSPLCTQARCNTTLPFHGWIRHQVTCSSSSGSIRTRSCLGAIARLNFPICRFWQRLIGILPKRQTPNLLKRLHEKGSSNTKKKNSLLGTRASGCASVEPALANSMGMYSFRLASAISLARMIPYRDQRSGSHGLCPLEITKFHKIKLYENDVS